MRVGAHGISMARGSRKSVDQHDAGEGGARIGREGVCGAARQLSQGVQVRGRHQHQLVLLVAGRGSGVRPISEVLGSDPTEPVRDVGEEAVG